MDTIQALGELSLASRMKRLSERLMKDIQLIYSQHGIDFDPYLFPAFFKIAEDKETTNSALCEALQTSQPGVTQTVNRLMDRELIELRPDSTDKRKKLIRLTTKGNTLYHRMQPVWKGMSQGVHQLAQSKSLPLLEHMDQLEENLSNGKFVNTLNAQIKLNSPIYLINYDPKFRQAFYDMNIEWLETFFYVEDYDREVLSDPEKFILDPGGNIFFAVQEEQPLGTVALMPYKDGIFELTKMAVSPKHRGKKIGQHLMQYCLDQGRKMGLSALVLYSNTKLENAIHIYRKFGFEEVEMEPDLPYERGNIKMVCSL